MDYPSELVADIARLYGVSYNLMGGETTEYLHEESTTVEWNINASFDGYSILFSTPKLLVDKSVDAFRWVFQRLQIFSG